MGVLLPTCIARKEITKARTTLCSSLPLLRLSPVGDLASTVASASGAYFGITVAPHEYFDQTGISFKLKCSPEHSTYTLSQILSGPVGSSLGDQLYGAAGHFSEGK